MPVGVGPQAASVESRQRGKRPEKTGMGEAASRTADVAEALRQSDVRTGRSRADRIRTATSW
jgi:hypothetical protein